MALVGAAPFTAALAALTPEQEDEALKHSTGTTTAPMASPRISPGRRGASKHHVFVLEGDERAGEVLGGGLRGCGGGAVQCMAIHSNGSNPHSFYLTLTGVAQDGVTFLRGSVPDEAGLTLKTR